MHGPHARLTPDQVTEAIDTYNWLREEATRHLKDHPDALGAQAWLSNAITDTDITLTSGDDPTLLYGYGSTASAQTGSHERFEFAIPLIDPLADLPYRPQPEAGQTPEGTRTEGDRVIHCGDLLYRPQPKPGETP